LSRGHLDPDFERELERELAQEDSEAENDEWQRRERDRIGGGFNDGEREED
jgi:hypothetical protein